MLYGYLNIEAFLAPFSDRGGLRRGHMIVIPARLSEDLNLIESLEYRRDYAQSAFPDRSEVRTQNSEVRSVSGGPEAR
jgi:hypothetical protein